MADDTTALIAPALRLWPMNDEQRSIVSHKHGPMLVIAGPGSGKTRSLTLLAMNLLLCGDAKPSEIVLCTYTEKAAFELQDRLANTAHLVDYNIDLSQLQIGTIHSICQRIINRYLHRSPLGNDYETLDHFTQHLLIFEHLGDICKKNALAVFRHFWSTGTDWQVANKLQFMFDKIAEELIFERLKKRYAGQSCPKTPQEIFLYYLTYAYDSYQKLLVERNCIDFAHLEKCAYNLLQKPDIFEKVTSEIHYVLVDEYQDTNFIQERLLTLLASGQEPKNLCVIGDEDQALYRFRGATVRNILEFNKTFPGSKEIHLTTNYRSHPSIINVCNDWMNSFDWSHMEGANFRTAKTIRTIPGNIYDKYPAILSISSVSVINEAEQFAEWVCWLKQQGTIGDYSEVALLLHSVRPWMSKPYIDALKEKEIPAYCPRARTFFQDLEICLLVGCLARILGYKPGMHGATSDETDYLSYISDCRRVLVDHCRKFSVLEQQLHTMEEEIQALTAHPEQDDKQRLGDYFYRLLCIEPFASFLANEDSRFNLVLFSRLLQTFQRYYRYEYISGENLQQLREAFLPAFLSFLYTEGIPQDENRQEPSPKGQVQILTIHEAKGLEFPVVVVGRLDKLPLDLKDDDQALKTFYEHPSFEPEERIADFDRRRLYYVALSRAKQLLVCSSGKKPQSYFNTLWKHTTSWPFTYPRLIHIPVYIQTGEHQAPKPRYGFTSHIQTYNTCPRRYQYFYEYQFQPSRTAETFFGLLIYQTVERIHRSARDGNFDIFEQSQIREAFDTVFHFLLCSHAQPCDEVRKEQAFRMVCNYVFSNRLEMRCIAETELSFRVEQEQYVLVGQYRSAAARTFRPGDCRFQSSTPANTRFSASQSV